MNTPTISTSDIVLAATLKLKGYRLQSIQRDGKRGIFHFDEVPQDVVTEFNLGNSLVEPNALNNAIRALSTATKRSVI